MAHVLAVEQITPDQAAAWLSDADPACVTAARRDRPTVERYVASMRTGLWRVEPGSFLRLDRAERLRDGLRRLVATVESKTILSTYVEREQ